MAGERMKLEVKEREGRGSADSRRLRKQGLVPGVLYGRGKPPHPFCVPERELRRALSGESGLHAILDVVLDGQTTTHPSVLKDYQQEVPSGRLAHIDLHEVRLDQPIQATVAVDLIGEAAGVKEGGVLSQVSRDLRVEALPLEIPDHLELDVSGMAIGDTLRLVDLPLLEEHLGEEPLYLTECSAVLERLEDPNRFTRQLLRLVEIAASSHDHRRPEHRPGQMGRGADFGEELPGLGVLAQRLLVAMTPRVQLSGLVERVRLRAQRPALLGKRLGPGDQRFGSVVLLP